MLFYIFSAFFLCTMVFFAYLRGMFNQILKHKGSLLSVLSAVFLSGLFGCASTGSPGGGLYDEDPPELRKAEPSVGATGVKEQKITLQFNENIKLDNVMDKMTVSPPQAKMPVVKSNAKTMTIELQDTLLPNTTYSIDLGDAVQDNNEGNPLEGLSILFSTGDHIDSLQVSGYLLNAEDLEPIAGAYVGIYNDTIQDGDSILMKYPMERAGRTDQYGKFSILGIAPGSYRMYALVDGNTNYKYDMNSEDIAFLDSLIVPSTMGHIVFDTLWQDVDSTTIDTITSRGEILYLPNDIVLKAFNEGKVTRYLDDYSRPDSIHLNIRFAAKMPELPTIAIVDPDEDPIDLICEPNPTNDTLTYWIRDSLHFNRDTLYLQVSYLFTDTTGFDITRTDTLRFEKPIVKQTKQENTEEKKGEKKKRSRKSEKEKVEIDTLPKITFMTVKLNSSNKMDIGSKPILEVSAPVDSIDLSKIHLEVQKDTLWNEMKFSIEKDTSSIRRFSLLADPHFSPGGSYRIIVDSAAIHDIYNHPVNKTELKFTEKTTEEYSHLLFDIEGAEGPSYVELLSAKDLPVYRAKVENGKAKFVNVKEGTYYARLVEDRNNNGKFDTGNFFERTQPENVYYFNGELQLRANWDLAQNWDIKRVNIVKQKPDSVKKNKPKEKAERKSKNAEYLAKLGKTPKQTNTGTTTTTGTSSRMQRVDRNR